MSEYVKEVKSRPDFIGAATGKPTLVGAVILSKMSLMPSAGPHPERPPEIGDPPFRLQTKASRDRTTPR